MPFPSKAGCPMCGIVSAASHMSHNSPRSPSFPAGSTAPEVLWRDDNFTAYREKANAVSSQGHIVIVFNLHVPSIYTLSSSDVPLLADLKSLARRLLSGLVAPPTPSTSAFSPQLPAASPTSTPLSPAQSQFRIGFITPPFKDNKIPVTDHLHAHAYIFPNDLCGWWRGVAYGSLAWYAVDDLIAEIRESTSNNRVKSGYESRGSAPIDMVPHAGARMGTADGTETTESSLSIADLERGEYTPPASRSHTPFRLELTHAGSSTPSSSRH